MDLNFATPVIQSKLSEESSILAIDDDEDNLIIISYVLSAMGYPFMTATRGDEGLLIAQNYQPSLILLDILLPGMNGFEVITHLKQNPSAKNIPIIAVTGLAFPEDKKRILEAGCEDYLSKPYLIRDLEILVNHHLDKNLSCSSSRILFKHKN
ncbi:response regulator receiver protein [Gloeothece citriformis PCC 7424]|uniref:Response regulator receiver protein n=1 Tax=Gloeothece citriformis (strain PCC 7424) TaxID=65393 RepID=B7KCK1_GLOC7|nr:response regulator [Gloeothece citriformis]ACK71552.1 response regulator receiver protein [Gloeothece citriformis PCC 7424]